MEAGNIKAIIFDSEGVVIDTEPIWDLSQHEFLSRRGVVYDRQKIKARLTGKSMDDSSRVMKDFYGLQGEIEELSQERRDIIEKLFAERVDFVKGFWEFHQTVVTPSYRSCIATAMEPAIFGLIDQRLQLNRLFNEHVYFIADVGFRSKPDPAIFCYSADKLGVPYEQCLVIEDSPVGIEAAIKANMPCIALTTTFSADVFNSMKGVHIADDYAAVKRYLAVW